MSTTVRDNSGQSRYDIHDIHDIHDGETLAGFPECRITGWKTAFTTTQVLTPAQGSR
ncbi:hypothetical protein [Streptomyces sp. JNUCC 63]